MSTALCYCGHADCHAEPNNPRACVDAARKRADRFERLFLDMRTARDVRQRYGDRMKDQRNRLLAALKGIMDPTADQTWCVTMDCGTCQECEARAAIASAQS